MTAHPSNMTAHPYPLENVWKKGHYVARVTGPHPKYRYDRDFLSGTPIKTRGTVEYRPDDIGDLPAWIVRTPEIRCGECGRPKQTETQLIAATAPGWHVIGNYTPAEIARIWAMGPPGTPGAFTVDDVCAGCGKAGYPAETRCDDCEMIAAEKMTAPKEDPF